MVGSGASLFEIKKKTFHAPTRRPNPPGKEFRVGPTAPNHLSPATCDLRRRRQIQQVGRYIPHSEPKGARRRHQKWVSGCQIEWRCAQRLACPVRVHSQLASALALHDDSKTEGWHMSRI